MIVESVAVFGKIFASENLEETNRRRYHTYPYGDRWDLLEGQSSEV